MLSVLVAAHSCVCIRVDFRKGSLPIWFLFSCLLPLSGQLLTVLHFPCSLIFVSHLEWCSKAWFSSFALSLNPFSLILSSLSLGFCPRYTCPACLSLAQSRCCSLLCLVSCTSSVEEMNWALHPVIWRREGFGDWMLRQEWDSRRSSNDCFVLWLCQFV